jgi:hypothetical protein
LPSNTLFINLLSSILTTCPNHCNLLLLMSATISGYIKYKKINVKAVPWLRRLVAGLPPRRTGFDPGPVHVGFVVIKVALGQVLPRVLRFSPVNFIPPVLHYLEK